MQIAVVYKQCKGADSRWPHTKTGHLRSSAHPLMSSHPWCRNECACIDGDKNGTDVDRSDCIQEVRSTSYGVNASALD